eukprot:g59328.t1
MISHEVKLPESHVFKSTVLSLVTSITSIPASSITRSSLTSCLISRPHRLTFHADVSFDADKLIFLDCICAWLHAMILEFCRVD